MSLTNRDRIAVFFAFCQHPCPLRHCFAMPPCPLLALSCHLPRPGESFKVRGLGSPRKVYLFAKGSPFGKDFPRSGENGKVKKGNSWTPIGGLRGLGRSFYFMPFSPSQCSKKQARAAFQSRTSLPTVQRSIQLSRALHLGRSALSGCFSLYSALVQGATVASTPDRRMISEAKSYQEQMPSPVQWYRPYSWVTQSCKISWARSTALVGLPHWSLTTSSLPNFLPALTMVLTKFLP